MVHRFYTIVDRFSSRPNPFLNLGFEPTIHLSIGFATDGCNVLRDVSFPAE